MPSLNRDSVFVVPFLPVGFQGRKARRQGYSRYRRRGIFAVSEPLQIAIAGGGIAGLSTALALTHSLTPRPNVTIFEPREGADLTSGAALNLSGGAAVLVNYYGIPLSDCGTPVSEIRGRGVGGFPLYTIDIPTTVKNDPQAARSLTDKNGNALFFTVMRGDLQRLLIEAVSPHVKIIRGPFARVETLVGNRLRLADGTETGEFNLIIGADGLRSKLRPLVTGRPNPPTYTGLRVQWSMSDSNGDDTAGALFHYYGKGGLCLRYCAGSPGKEASLLGLVFRDASPVDENEGYRASEAVRERMRGRLAQMDMPPDVFQIFDRGVRFIETGVYQYSLTNRWSRQHCTLVGDAAHAMQPILGQGANQAIQDAHALAKAIEKSGAATNPAALPTALQKYESIRRVPAEAVLQSSRVVGIIDTLPTPLGQLLRDSAFWAMGKAGLVEKTFLKTAVLRVE